MHPAYLQALQLDIRLAWALLVIPLASGSIVQAKLVAEQVTFEYYHSDAVAAASEADAATFAGVDLEVEAIAMVPSYCHFAALGIAYQGED